MTLMDGKTMNYEHQRIQKTLKQLMKKNGESYQSVAKTLRISPATVKRRLNGPDMTIQQLKEFAEVFSMSFYEVLELSKGLQREAYLFTPEQEKLLASKLSLMSVFRLILAGQSYAQIKTALKFSDKDMRKTASDFERAGLAQLLPGDRFVALVHFPFRWQPNGALSKAYDGVILKNMLRRIENDNKGAGLNRKFELAMSRDSYRNFCTDIQSVYDRYRGLSEIHLSSRIELDQIVSGIFFIDQFSIWD